jgi:hypothetical protein
MWADSAYSVSPRVIPVHKKPAADLLENRQFDTAVAHIRIRSEHCMGALKGRWQSLRGLRIAVNRKRDHVYACDWIRMCILLHNLVVDLEGEEWAEHYWRLLENDGEAEQATDEVDGEGGETADVDAAGQRTLGEQKRQQLVADYTLYKEELRRIREMELDTDE